MTKICRLCLTEVTQFLSINYTDDAGVSASSFVKALIPELYLGVSYTPVVCVSCYGCLRQAYNFRLNCLRTENLIGIFIRETKYSGERVRLRDVIKYLQTHKNKPVDVQDNLVEWVIKKPESTAAPVIVSRSASECTPWELQHPKNDSNLQTEKSLSDSAKGFSETEKGEKESAASEKEKDKPEKENTTDKELLNSLLSAPAVEICLDENDEEENSDKSPNDAQKDKHGSNCPMGQYHPSNCKDGTVGSFEYPFRYFCKKSLESEKTFEEIQNEDTSRGKSVDAAAEFDEYMNKVCLESSEPGKTNAKQSESAVGPEKNDSETMFRVKPLKTYAKQTKSGVEPGENDSATMLRFKHAKTYSKQSKSRVEPEENDSATMFRIKPVHKKNQINLVADDVSKLNDADIKSLVKELQKTENLKILGFSGSNSTEEGSYVLKKIIDKSDNALSFALLPMVDDAELTDFETSDTNDVLSENSTTAHPVEKESKPPLIELLDNLRGRIKLFKKINETYKKFSEESINTFVRVFEEGVKVAIKDASDMEKSDAIENIEKGYLYLIERLVKANNISDLHQAEGYECLRADDIEEKHKGNKNIQEESKKSFSNASDQSQGKDEESLGVITFPPDPQDANKPSETLDPSPKDQPSDKPMPLIRVRPVSSLQKVRTLNHELWPQKAVSSAAKVNFEAPVVHRVPTKLVDSDSSQPPIVLNSKLVLARKGAPLLRRITKIVDQAAVDSLSVRQVKKLGINPLHLSKVNYSKKFRKIRPAPEKPTNDAASKDRERLCSSNVAMEHEDVIDIKEEPLHYTDNELLDFDTAHQSFQEPTESGGETTRSASETSFIDTPIDENDALKLIMDNISEVGDYEFDEPEYVHINKVSLNDMARIISESKRQKEEAVLQVIESVIESGLSQVVRTPNRISNSSHRQNIVKTVAATEASTVGRTTGTKRRAGKRIRIVPVDADADEAPEPQKRRVVSQRSVLKTSVKGAPLQKSSPKTDQNVCVLYTNFTSEGDYINDHDYLLSPYTRNNMHYIRETVPVCVCLLCDLVHQASDHVQHMKSHKTVCELCRIDFHNVFILNLHVRSHNFLCTLCKRTITYGNYNEHDEFHFRSQNPRNINSTNTVVNSNESSKIPSQQEREKEPPSSDRKFMSLAQLLDEPVNNQYPFLVVSRSDQPKIRRPSSRVYGEDCNLEEEEACIYDKSTKSFITPTKETQQKLLEEINSENEKTDPNKATNNTCIILDDSSTEDEDKTTRTSNSSSNINNLLLCDEKIDKEINIISYNKDLVQTNKLSNQPDDSVENKPKKLSRTGKKRRVRRIFTVRPKKKALNRDIQDDKLKNNVDEVLNSATEQKEKISKKKPMLSDSRSQVIDLTNTKTLRDPKSDLPVKSTHRTYSTRSRISNLTNSDSTTVVEKRPFRRSRSSTKVDQLKSELTSNLSESNTAISDISKELSEGIKSQNDSFSSLKTDSPSEDTAEIDASKIAVKKTLTVDDVTKDRCTKPVILHKSIESTSYKIVSPTTTRKKETRKTAKVDDGKSAERENLKIKILSIKKYDRLVSKAKKSTPVAKEQPALKSYSKKREMAADNPEDLSNALPVQEEEKNTAVNIAKQKSPDVAVDTKKRKTEGKSVKNIEKNVKRTDDGKKDGLRPNPFTSDKARSSRSRGSLGLVEGLKGSEIKRPGRKVRQKFKIIPKEESSLVDLNASQSTDVEPRITPALDAKLSQRENVEQDNKTGDNFGLSAPVKETTED